MGILIKGMDEIPEDGAVLVVKHDNGKAYIKHACTYGYSMELVKLPAVQPDHVADISKKAEKEDYISRQTAVDLFPDDDLEYDTKGGYVAPHLARRMICELPSAQPDHNADIGKKISISCSQENDLISRREALNAITDELMQSTSLSAVIRAKNRLRDLSAVQPERIRCKDCKYWRDDHTCHEHSLVSPMCANEYCSRAERRTDERFD